jgi:hypothetical protein
MLREKNRRIVMAYSNVDDEYGLVKTNEYLTMFIPATKKVMIYRVLSRQNPGLEMLNYGPIPLPVTSGAMGTLDGGTTTATSGVIPSRGVTTRPIQFAPPSDVVGSFDSSDMWYMDETYRDRIFHLNMYITPAWTRVAVEIPTGTKQQKFQKDRVQVGVSNSFGWASGKIETVHIPALRYGYDFGNEMNINCYTSVKFIYGEYQIAIPTDPDLVFDIITQARPSHWVTLPVFTNDSSMQTAFQKNYNFQGFPIYDKTQRQAAISEYSQLIATIDSRVADTMGQNPSGGTRR